jgi:DNA-binding MarR family transcriptional regulator
MVDVLARDDLVRIKRSPTDGRSRLIELTKEGGCLLEKAVPLWQEGQRQFEQLNGAENGAEKVTALRQGLAEMIVGDAATSSSG